MFTFSNIRPSDTIVEEKKTLFKRKIFVLGKKNKAMY